MNPFTRFLRQWMEDDNLEKFVQKWDGLEALVVRVYRQGEVRPSDETQFQALQDWLLVNYGRWEEQIEPYWRQTTIAGRVAQRDPFRALLAPESAADFVGNWDAMQQLPAAREALNRLIIEHGN
jgi:hypothetical protein